MDVRGTLSSIDEILDLREFLEADFAHPAEGLSDGVDVDLEIIV